MKIHFALESVLKIITCNVLNSGQMGCFHVYMRVFLAASWFKKFLHLCSPS